MSPLRIRSTPDRIDPPTQVWVPFLVGMVHVAVPDAFDPDGPPPGQVHAVVHRADGSGTRQTLHVRANRHVIELVGDRLVEVMADVVATGGVEGDAVFFTGAYADIRPVTRAVHPHDVVRRFLNTTFDSLGGASYTAEWGPLIPPAHMAAELETVRLRIVNPHGEAILRLLAEHGRRNPAEAVGQIVASTQPPFAVQPFSISGQSLVFRLYQAVVGTVLDFHGRGEIDDTILSQPAEVRVERRWRDAGLPVPATWEQAVDTAVHLVDTTTAGFAPRLQLVDESTTRAWVGHALPTILPTLCMQLIRTVSLDSPVRDCATCLETFVPTRSNQIHCDARCAHATAKRRARERARVAGPEQRAAR